MSFESLMAISQRLSVSVDALAALGAELRWRQEGLEGDARVRALLHEVVNAVDLYLLDGIDPDREACVLALIQTIFRQAVDLLENPGRVPAWTYLLVHSHQSTVAGHIGGKDRCKLAFDTLGRNGKTSLPDA